MIKKFFLLGLVLLAAGQLFAQSFKMITLSADGSTENYLVSEVQKITFDTGSDKMIVNLKTGSDVANITCVSFEDATGIQTPKPESSISVFPNPVQETLTVNGVKKDAVINVYSMSGALLKTVTAQDNSTKVDVSSLQQGIYLLQIDKQVVKFIKK